MINEQKKEVLKIQAKLLKKIRVDRNLSLIKTSEKTGIHITRVFRIESGISLMSTLEAMCYEKAFDVDVYEQCKTINFKIKNVGF